MENGTSANNTFMINTKKIIKGSSIEHGGMHAISLPMIIVGLISAFDLIEKSLPIYDLYSITQLYFVMSMILVPMFVYGLSSIIAAYKVKRKQEIIISSDEYSQKTKDEIKNPGSIFGYIAKHRYGIGLTVSVVLISFGIIISSMYAILQIGL